MDENWKPRDGDDQLPIGIDPHQRTLVQGILRQRLDDDDALAAMARAVRATGTAQASA